ncbi:helix-turn-helix domain-containing protein [Clostridium tepidum]|uniref:helix-turn-helix domain-containing protein n=1 Tax=Clostridium tepidum TaxID=1962263 RepID=UPI002149B9CE|nr:helix-turn-helix transcriptional regulator [Clostridium tepidum]MCR1933563.1 helix-turn-helix domain-containing protein [Clostridium tepidum]
MFDENIKKIREQKGLGVNELSRISGVNASYISALERGEKQNPTITTLKKLADALEVTIDELMKSESVTYEKLKEWDKKYTDIVKEESETYKTNEITDVKEAMELILSQESLMLNGEILSDESKIALANAIKMGLAYAEQKQKENKK